MTLVFTICSNNYLAQAVVLGASLVRYNPYYSFKICLVDKKTPEINYKTIPFEVIEVELIQIKGFEEMFKKYNIIELNTAIKPFCFKYFFKNEPRAKQVFYLDPDIEVFNHFTDLENSLTDNEIVITPHFTTPIDDDKIQAENDILNSGLYNLGFLALKKGEESEKLLDWWSERMVNKAFIDVSKGLFTDQIWINFAPLFFDKVYTLRHPGYNMAYWNMHERSISQGMKVIKGSSIYSLILFHFSGFNPLKPDILSKYQDRYSFEDRPDVIDLFSGYQEKLLENNYCSYNKYLCTYSTLKQEIDRLNYLKHKRSIPIYKRILRGLILRFLNLFKIKAEYYIK